MRMTFPGTKHCSRLQHPHWNWNHKSTLPVYSCQPDLSLSGALIPPQTLSLGKTVVPDGLFVKGIFNAFYMFPKTPIQYSDFISMSVSRRVKESELMVCEWTLNGKGASASAGGAPLNMDSHLQMSIPRMTTAQPEDYMRVFFLTPPKSLIAIIRFLASC